MYLWKEHVILSTPRVQCRKEIPNTNLPKVVCFDRSETPPRVHRLLETAAAAIGGAGALLLAFHNDQGRVCGGSARAWAGHQSTSHEGPSLSLMWDTVISKAVSATVSPAVVLA